MPSACRAEARPSCSFWGLAWAPASGCSTSAESCWASETKVLPLAQVWSLLRMETVGLHVPGKKRRNAQHLVKSGVLVVDGWMAPHHPLQVQWPSYWLTVGLQQLCSLQIHTTWQKWWVLAGTAKEPGRRRAPFPVSLCLKVSFQISL